MGLQHTELWALPLTVPLVGPCVRYTWASIWHTIWHGKLPSLKRSSIAMDVLGRHQFSLPGIVLLVFAKGPRSNGTALGGAPQEVRCLSSLWVRR